MREEKDFAVGMMIIVLNTLRDKMLDNNDFIDEVTMIDSALHIVAREFKDVVV